MSFPGGQGGNDESQPQTMKMALLRTIEQALKEGVINSSDLNALLEEPTGENGGGLENYKPPEGRYLGLIKSFSHQKGYGFMVCTSEGEWKDVDIYIHKTVFDQIWPPPNPQVEHDVFEFTIHTNKEGKPQASNPSRPRVPGSRRPGPPRGYGPPAPFGGYGPPPGARGGRGGRRGPPPRYGPW